MDRDTYDRKMGQTGGGDKILTARLPGCSVMYLTT